MKVAFLSTFYPYRGGIAQFNAQLFRHFEKTDAELKAWNFSLQYPSILFPGTSQYVNEKDKADPIPNQRTLNSINPFSYLSTAKQIKAYQPDLLIMRYWMPFFAPALGTVAKQLKKQGTKVIVIIDNLIPHEKRIGDEAMTQYLLKNADAFVVMSDIVEKDLKNVYPQANYIFHPHPIYDHFGEKPLPSVAKQQLQIDSDKKTLLYFGLIRKYKGLDLLIEAFDQLDDSYQLLIVGEPYEDFGFYQQLIDKNSNKERIHCATHYIDDKDVPQYFSASDVCVLPYRTATQSGVIAISYHFDIPVIVTDVGGLKNTVEPYNAGIVIERPEKELITEAIERYFQKGNPEMMEKSIVNFKTQYSWDSLVKKITELYKSLA